LKKIDLGQTLQLLGNVGVIVGIFLLVYELNQNRDLMQAQTRHELSQGLVELLIANNSDSELMSIRLRGNRGEDLTELEFERFQMAASIEMRYHEDVHYQYRNGLYDETEFNAQREMWKNIYAAIGRKVVFCTSRSGYSPEFVKEIEGLLGNSACESIDEQ
jgi:hypothetical protein